MAAEASTAQEKELASTSEEIEKTLQKSREVSESISSLQNRWKMYEDTMNTLNHRFLQTVLPQYRNVESQLQNKGILESAVSMSLNRATGTDVSVDNESTLRWAEHFLREEENNQLMKGIQASLESEPGKQVSENEVDEDDELLSLALHLSKQKSSDYESSSEDESEALERALRISLVSESNGCNSHLSNNPSGVRVNAGVEESKC